MSAGTKGLYHDGQHFLNVFYTDNGIIWKLKRFYFIFSRLCAFYFVYLIAENPVLCWIRMKKWDTLALLLRGSTHPDVFILENISNVFSEMLFQVENTYSVLRVCAHGIFHTFVAFDFCASSGCQGYPCCHPDHCHLLCDILFVFRQIKPDWIRGQS